MAIQKWVERNSLPVSVWEDPEKVDEVLRVIDTRLDGKQAAAWSRKRNRRILNVAMKYAIRRRILRVSPLPKGKESTAVAKTMNAVDKRSLLNPEQAAAILDWIRRRPRGGKRLHAFFATWYYCGPTARGSSSHEGGGRDPAGTRRRRPVVRAADPRGDAGDREAVDRHGGDSRATVSEGPYRG
ncbi:MULTISPECIES: hypothetical protein [Streptomyces]|uniref:hypothetical protein n=1 Tax=Streptomyces TaxID=1883 RepID=UPI00198DF0C1|nr:MULTISPECIES: hypothetical protein [Streptomyces]GGS10524.1 hypothetical protein GCM10010236_76250 [Streptomyces eurythermus]